MYDTKYIHTERALNPYLTTYAHVRLSIFHRESQWHTFLLRILSSYVGKYPYFACVE